MTTRRFFFSIICLLGLIMQAHGAPLSSSEQQKEFDRGTAAYDAKDFETAYEIWLPLARKDDLAAQRNMGHLFLKGLGTEKNEKQAFYWYERAADAGLSSAQANVGILYLTGQGTDKDATKAASYLFKAARAGHTVAQYNIAVMFDKGIGVQADPIKALAFYYMAAKNDHTKAKDRLSQIVITSDLPVDETDYVQQVESDWSEDQKKTGFFVLDILSTIYKVAGAESVQEEALEQSELNRIEQRSTKQE